MAIRLITGVPGSGKSYYAVRHLRNTYCEYNKEEKTWYLKKGYTIITNIDCLLIEHLDLDDVLKKCNKTIGEFFTEPYQQSITKKYPKIIYFLDEAQKFFPRRNKYNEQTWFYFQYHRHLGHDVYLMSQDARTLPVELTCLSEFEIRACPRTLSVFGELKYNIKAGGEIIDRKIIKKDKNVFKLYKSMDADESEKLKNPFKKWFILFAVLGVVSVYNFRNTFIGGNYKNKIPSSSAAVASSQVNRSSSIQDQDSRNSKINAYSKNPFPQKPDFTRFKINSYFTLNRILFLLDPVTNSFLPQHDFPYSIQVTQTGRFKNIYAQIPTNLIPPPSPDPRQGGGEYSGKNMSSPPQT